MHRVIQIVLGGAGGQGMNLAGQILAQAFAEEEEKNVIETELYGISMRGGISLAQVLVSTGEVTDVRVTEPDIVVAMSGEFASAYVPKTKKGGVVLADSQIGLAQCELPTVTVLSMPFIQEARKLGNEMVANIVALGALTEVTGIVRRESLNRVLGKRFSGSVLEMNLKALDVGKALAGQGKKILSDFISH